MGIFSYICRIVLVDSIFDNNPKHLSSKPITIFGVKKNENMSLKYQKCVQDQKCKK